jgi:hypothetical protein
MKRCSYCGTEYPDDTAICAIDKTPLEGTQLETTHIEPPTFAIDLDWNKILSSLVCIVYGICALWSGGALALLQIIGIVVFPLGFIWYSDEIGSYTGATSSGWITSPTPAWIVCIFGWIFLLAPGIFAIYSIATRKH